MARYQKQREMFKGFEVCITREPDYDAPPPEVNADNYQGCTEAEIAEYVRQDQARLDAYNQDEWCYLQLGIELRVQTKQNWVVWTTVGRAYLSGVESDSGESYINDTLAELKDEAYDDARLTFEALQAIFAEVQSNA